MHIGCMVFQNKLFPKNRKVFVNCWSQVLHWDNLEFQDVLPAPSQALQ